MRELGIYHGWRLGMELALAAIGMGLSLAGYIWCSVHEQNIRQKPIPVRVERTGTQRG
jgi:hypothetical protein